MRQIFVHRVESKFHYLSTTHLSPTATPRISPAILLYRHAIEATAPTFGAARTAPIESFKKRKLEAILRPYSAQLQIDNDNLSTDDRSDTDKTNLGPGFRMKVQMRQART